MRVFAAGASGLTGRRLVPLLVANHHDIAAAARTPSRVEGLQIMGTTPVLCDVFDHDELVNAVTGCNPDVAIHQLTDLPNDRTLIGEHSYTERRNPS
ncbi:NAD(P)H-binding protein [Ferrimicrobium acidiphilum]|uniref:NAD(P)H-binding protein n=1 Tax=Ferrimicrobium acidiphilum TaxID=121039 RepID=UPI0023F0B2C3|nr:NAD(P)H-binding protein [Ferrimicrobium acidiphilum]